MELAIREAGPGDLDSLLALYTHLHGEAPPDHDRAMEVWSAIQADLNHHILLCEVDGIPVSSCVLVILPNLTRCARPYGLIENVVTHPNFRGRGHATALLHRATALAQAADCYKVMLLTGRKDQTTLDFYQHAGFCSEDKTAFLQWL